MTRAIHHAGRIALLVGAAALAGCSSDPEPTVVHRTAAEYGAALFRDPTIAGSSVNAYACSTCHATTAEAQGDAILPGAPLAGVTARPSYWGGQEMDLLRSINHCLYYFMLKDEPWTADDVEARAMYAYLESLSQNTTGSAAEAQPFTVAYLVEDVPGGDAQKGADLYDRSCASCHGDAHNGAGRLVQWAPVLPEQVFDEHPSSQYTPLDRRLVFIEKTRHGGFVLYGGQMPPFSYERLSDEDLGAVLSYLGVTAE